MLGNRSTIPPRRATFRVRVVAVLAMAAAMVPAMLAGGGHPASADAITDKIGVVKGQLAADGTAMAQLRGELAAAASQQAALEKAIGDLDNQIGTTEAQVNAAQAQLDEIDTNLSVAEDNLALTEQKLVDDRRQLTLEVVVMYKAQNASNFFSNFLNSGDFNGLWQHVLDVHRLGSAEQQLVGVVTTDAANVAADVATIRTQRANQAQLLATLHGIVVQLNDALATRRSAAAQLVVLQAQDNAVLLANERAAAQLKAQIAALQSEEAAALAAGGGHGQFAWPETGPITQGFGCTDYTREPPPPPGFSCASGHFHSGIDIGDPCGTPIHAADAGIATLFYSGSGFGDHVVIVHGNGWDSVYGHMLRNFAIASGQTVQRGQLIGYEGSTGNSSGCHLHFEIDLNQVPQNPLHYLS